MEDAICLHAFYYAIWKRYGALPERYNWQLQAPDVLFYPLRPELVESTYLLYQVTGLLSTALPLHRDLIELLPISVLLEVTSWFSRMEKVSAAKYTFDLTFNKDFCFYCGLNFLIPEYSREEEKTSSYSFQICVIKEPFGGYEFFFPALWWHKSINTKVFFVCMFLKEGFIIAWLL